MKITAIKPQAKNPERVSIFVDRKYSFSLNLDELLSQKLKKDDELEKDDVKRLQKISADGKLRMRALEWVLNRPRSIREFRDYMYRKKAEPEQIGALTKDFSSRGYLDERKFGQWLIELQKRHGKSDRAIRTDLFKKGLDRELVDELLADGSDDEAERLMSLIAKKQKATRYKNDPVKLAKYLTSQGFSYSIVMKQLNLKRVND